MNICVNYVGKIAKMKNDFETLMDTIMSEGIAIIESLTPEQLENIDV